VAKRFAPELLAYHQPEHPVSLQFRELLGRTPEKAFRPTGSFASFTALQGGIGTTTVLLTWRSRRPKEGPFVSPLIDGDLREPGSHSTGIAGFPGLVDFLGGRRDPG